MILIDGRKYACPQCVRGHRVGSCQHRDRELIEIRPKGRPATQCKHCRSQRNSRQLHIRCNCGVDSDCGDACTCGVTVTNSKNAATSDVSAANNGASCCGGHKTANSTAAASSSSTATVSKKPASTKKKAAAASVENDTPASLPLVSDTSLANGITNALPGVDANGLQSGIADLLRVMEQQTQQQQQQQQRQNTIDQLTSLTLHSDTGSLVPNIPTMPSATGQALGGYDLLGSLPTTSSLYEANQSLNWQSILKGPLADNSTFYPQEPQLHTQQSMAPSVPQALGTLNAFGNLTSPSDMNFSRHDFSFSFTSPTYAHPQTMLSPPIQQSFIPPQLPQQQPQLQQPQLQQPQQPQSHLSFQTSVSIPAPIVAENSLPAPRPKVRAVDGVSNPRARIEALLNPCRCSEKNVCICCRPTFKQVIRTIDSAVSVNSKNNKNDSISSTNGTIRLPSIGALTANMEATTPPVTTVPPAKSPVLDTVSQPDPAPAPASASRESSPAQSASTLNTKRKRSIPSLAVEPPTAANDLSTTEKTDGGSKRPASLVTPSSMLMDTTIQEKIINIILNHPNVGQFMQSPVLSPTAITSALAGPASPRPGSATTPASSCCGGGSSGKHSEDAGEQTKDHGCAVTDEDAAADGKPKPASACGFRTTGSCSCGCECAGWLKEIVELCRTALCNPNDGSACSTSGAESDTNSTPSSITTKSGSCCASKQSQEKQPTPAAGKSCCRTTKPINDDATIITPSSPAPLPQPSPSTSTPSELDILTNAPSRANTLPATATTNATVALEPLAIPPELCESCPTYVDEDGFQMCGCGCAKPSTECSNCVRDGCENLFATAVVASSVPRAPH